MSAKLIAMMLCLAMSISMGAVAAGEEIQDEPIASEGTQPPSEGGEGTETPPEGGDGTENPPEGGDGTENPPDDGTLKVSDELLRVLKQLEGFSPYAFWDYKQWSIGYGSECPKGMEEYYQKIPSPRNTRKNSCVGNWITLRERSTILSKEMS